MTRCNHNRAPGNCTDTACRNHRGNASRGGRRAGYQDMTGRRFGKLTVQSEAPSAGVTRWRCVCECGQVVLRTGPVLRRSEREGHNASCPGCNKFANGRTA